jgi:hypothetical protein
VWDRHRTRGHDGRNGVFVDHLGDCIFQQHDVLVERFDLALQLNAVDQVNRDLNVLFTQGVEERILEGLSFIAHFLFSANYCWMDANALNALRFTALSLLAFTEMESDC